MNARDPLQPIQKDEAEALGRFAERVWDDEIVPQITKYIEVPAKSPMFDAEWQEHGFIDRVVRDAAAWVERQQVQGLEARGDPPRGPHAGDLLRRAGDAPRRQRRRRRDDLPLRPPRQAARVQRLEERLRPVDAALREGPALRPRRRRRRLRDLRRDHRDQVARPAGNRPAALRRPDRDLRGKRLARPAVLRRRAARAARPHRPGRLPRQRRRQLRPALAHDQPARQHHRHAQGRDPDRGRALGRRQRPGAVELSHPAPGARPPRGFEDRAPPARELPLRDSRPSASSRRRRPRRSSATRSGSAFRGRAAPTAGRRCRRRPIRSRRSSTAPGGRRSRSPASTACRR